ncbi:E3 ubiquitin-protein ligase RNFT1-like [Juglans microcarpa x Juglans regia]|uniref:E3 ubiquitin-protein ligase RNFT1-like n=1 Tax=Juglans microcarpa x Juglans regia TaxID=2249226 RepID=UPI001B7E55ED|nr:E3 ubiquitin-protein ligase RNFT1-like [Juglans microcarpa x Juglans regia]
METSATASNSPSSSSSSGNGSSSNGGGISRRYRIQVAASNIIHGSLAALLEYSGIVLGGGRAGRSNSQETEYLQVDNNDDERSPRSSLEEDQEEEEEVSIRIIGAAEAEHQRFSAHPHIPANPAVVSLSDLANSGGTASTGTGTGTSTSTSSYDIQHLARWIEQVLPFSLLLLLVLIRQHLQGFSVTLWIAAVMFKSNDILRKQTALKEERKISVLLSISLVFMLHVVCVYWWYPSNDLLYPFVLLPPKVIPPFWHAVSIVMVNDIMVRQAAMAFKCILLMHFKNSRGWDYRKQGQMLTLVEYLLLLYRALLPTPVWYRFFLNKEYGSLFSSLTTGLYLTFKLTSVVEKVQSLFSALRVLSHKEVHYGSYATSEQVNAAGDLCAICQEKMHAPILLRCKHIFCEDCVSEWFERERTCPLCRALVKPADIKSFGDGSTSLSFQLF